MVQGDTGGAVMGIEIFENDLTIHAHTQTGEHHGSYEEIRTNF